MKPDKISKSDDGFGEFSTDLFEISNPKEASKGSNRGLYLQNKSHNSETNTLLASCESQDSDNAELSYLSNGSCGVDKTRIAVRIQSDTVHIPTFMERLLRPKQFGNPVEGIANIENYPEIYVKWDYANLWLTMEFNPSDFCVDFGIPLCPFEAFPDIVENVIRKVFLTADPTALPVGAKPGKHGSLRFELPEDWARDVMIFRLDLARDFIVTDRRFSLEQLEEVWPLRSRFQASTHFLNGGKLNTLSYPVSDRTTKIKLYDKHAERKMKPNNRALSVPEGTFRFEASFPRHQLRLTHLTTLDVLSERRLANLLKDKWETSKFWVNLTWEGSAFDTAHSVDLPSHLVNEVLGYLECARLGIHMNYSSNELDALKTLAKRLGLNHKSKLGKQGMPYGHLHFNSGDISAALPDTFTITNRALFGILYEKPLIQRSQIS